MALLLDDALRRQLEVPAVLGHLIFWCFELYEHTAADIEKHWGISADQAYGLGIRSTPTLIGNVIVSQDCVKRFGADTLSRVDGFYSFTREGSICVCLDWNDYCVCDLPCWRLDIDLFTRGLIVPQRSPIGHFRSLKIFRHARDQYPFTLKVRREAAA